VTVPDGDLDKTTTPRDANSASHREIPFEFSKERSREAWDFFRFCNLRTGPILRPTNAITAHAAQLRAVYNYRQSIPRFSSPLDWKICELSLTLKGFNEQYAKMHKYAIQCLYGKQWLEPDDFPFEEGHPIGVHSWSGLRDTIKGAKFSVEPLIRPELLFPWQDELPSALDILEEEEEPPLVTINKDRARNILRDLLKPMSRYSTMTDFMMAQTNTNKVVSHKTLSSAIKAKANGKKLTEYKYHHLPKWFDSGQGGELFAVRTPAWKRPTEYRDAITCSPPLLLKVWQLNQYLKYSFSDAIKDSVGDIFTDVDVYRWFKKNKAGREFLMTDYKKSGLTMPHWFTEMVVEVLNEKNPDLRFSFPTGGWPIYDPKTGKIFTPNGYGYGLGMVNNVYTLFNYTIFCYAKEDGLFDEEAKMLTFNDDSVICCENHSYYRWLRLINQFGGWADVHKSFTSDLCMFLECYHCEGVMTSHKWVSFFHTIFGCFWKAANYHHWRFLVTDAWDQTKCGDRDSGWNFQAWEVAELAIKEIVIPFSEIWYGVRSVDCTPQLHPRGISLPPLNEERAKLNPSLVILEQLDPGPLALATQNLTTYKRIMGEGVKFRPWKLFPEGRTKDALSLIGDLAGFEYELKVLSAKAQSKFVTDTETYRKQIWGPLAEQLEETWDKPAIGNFWDWAIDQDWAGYALPRCFVKDEIPFNRDNPRIWGIYKNPAPPKYSLPSIMVAFISYFIYGREDEVPFADIDFSRFYSWSSPIVSSDLGLITFQRSAEECGKLAAFATPWLTLSDYEERTGFTPMELTLPDFKGKQMLDFLKRIFPHDNKSFDWAIGATWYTKYPLPYTSDMKPTLDMTLPNLHEAIIVGWDATQSGKITPELEAHIRFLTLGDPYAKETFDELVYRLENHFDKINLFEAKLSMPGDFDTEEAEESLEWKEYMASRTTVLPFQRYESIIERGGVNPDLLETVAADDFRKYLEDVSRPNWTDTQTSDVESVYSIEEENEDDLLAQLMDEGLAWDQRSVDSENG